MKRVPQLDGLRGLAALAVVVAHYFGEVAHGVRALTFGWIGVGVFFVLSGYLIGGILLDRVGERGFLKEFYLRRAARILPAYLMVLAAVFVALALIGAASWRDPVLPLGAYLTFTTNVFLPMGYAGGTWLLPAWTLAVEEQFYLIAPALILMIPRAHLLKALAGLAMTALVFRAVVYPLNGEAAWTLLPAKADMLLYGVIAAWLERNMDLRARLAWIRGAILPCAVAMLACALAWDHAGIVIASPLFLGLGTAAFILSIVGGGPEGAWLANPWLRRAGVISYMLYLIHQPVNGLMHGLILGARPDIATAQQIAVTGLSVAVSIALSALSWRLVEGPILKRTRGPVRSSLRPASAPV